MTNPESACSRKHSHFGAVHHRQPFELLLGRTWSLLSSHNPSYSKVRFRSNETSTSENKHRPGCSLCGDIDGPPCWVSSNNSWCALDGNRNPGTKTIPCGTSLGATQQVIPRSSSTCTIKSAAGKSSWEWLTKTWLLIRLVHWLRSNKNEASTPAFSNGNHPSRSDRPLVCLHVHPHP
jgi:hypothetical protein